MTGLGADDGDVPEDLRDRRYRGLRVLGRGAQATTFEATDVQEGRLVAIKRFVVRGAASWKEVELAEREATVLSGLSHPLIPGYVEHFEEGGALYLVTTKIEGESLAALRARGGTLDEIEVAKLLRDLGDALRYLHGRSIVHRDVKPGNVIRTPTGRYVLVDFGAVQARLRPGGGSTVVGTFGYMAPEQFQGRARPTSDVYGAGATALTMWTGVEPEDLPHRGLAIDVRTALGRGAAEPLVHALERMVEPDPERRADRVPDVLGSEPARPPSKDETKQRKKERRGRGDERARPSEGSFQARLDRSREQMLGALDQTWREREGRARTKAARKEVRREAEREARATRREAKRAKKREKSRQRARVAGGITRVAVLLGLLVATIAVQIACRAIVPGVLVALSVIFGDGLRRAARVVSAAGERATIAIGRARERVTGLRLPDEERYDAEDEEAHERRASSVRIGADPGDAAVEDPSADVEAELELDAEDEAEEARRASRRVR